MPNPKPSKAELRQWYAKFKIEVYEKANIDMDRIEDLGRIKIFYFTKWTEENPMDPEGELRYACIPHDGLTYKDTQPPSVNEPDKYLQWVQDNLKPPESDDQIEKLYEMSREGTLLVFAPGGADSNMQQVYTDENGKITTSLPMSSMVDFGTEGYDSKYYLPPIPEMVKTPDPQKFNLPAMPIRPEQPKNMKPGLLSKIAYKLFGVDNDYAKKVQYEEDMAEFNEELANWNAAVNADTEDARSYKEALKARADYLNAIEKFTEEPLGKVSIIDIGLRNMSANRMNSNDENEMNEAKQVRQLRIQEVQFMKNLHSKLPQGEILGHLESINEKLNFADRTKTVIRHLLGKSPAPIKLENWMKRGIFDHTKLNVKKYEVPSHPTSTNREERVAHIHRLTELAEVAGLAALAHPDVLSDPLMDDLTMDEVYSKVLNNLVTVGVPDSTDLLPYVANAHEKAHEAIEAYGKGDPEPFADLLLTSILRTNREIASMPAPDTEHGINCLYSIGRMLKAIDQNEDLADAVKLSKEELEEARANVALHGTITKSLEAKQKLLEHALYKQDMTPEQMQDAACDILFEDYIRKECIVSYNSQTQSIKESAEYKAATTDKQRDLLLSFRTGHACNQKLLDANWVQEMKASIRKEINLDTLVTMKREDLGNLFSSRDAFAAKFAPTKGYPSAPVMEQSVPSKEISASLT